MKTVSNEAFEHARKYLSDHGRKLDAAWFRLVFEDGAKEDVYNELAAYRFGSGGFGRKLEPDHRTDLPSCHTTGTAFQWFERLDLPVSDAMVKGAIGFLQENYIESERRWPAFPKKANDDPHAVWWHFAEGEELCEAEKCWGLPSAEILGIMLKYDPQNELWHQCFETAVERLEEVSPQMDMNEMSCYVRMVNYLGGEKKERMIDMLVPVLENVIETDENKWSEYSAMPLMYINDPSSPFHDRFRESAGKNLDWETGRQTAEGCWGPNWKWWRDEEIWPEAEKEWKSYLTAEKLVILNRFGRIGKR